MYLSEMEVQAQTYGYSKKEAWFSGDRWSTEQFSLSEIGARRPAQAKLSFFLNNDKSQVVTFRT